jgi:sulfatase maturation enzyme AslB (radical SAM superfamily)
MVDWGDSTSPEPDDLPVTPLFGTAAFPSRLWIYTNFHCNLACGYCVVASSPAADPRSLGLPRFRALVDEAAREGFDEIYLTGGEPFLEPEIAEMIRVASGVAPTTVLTNAMLFTGRRRDELRQLAGIEGLTLQTSLDGAYPETHDRQRGAGSWQRAIDGINYAVSLGLRVSVATTQTPDNTREIVALGELLEQLGVRPGDHAVRPLVARGFSESGLDVEPSSVVPELTVSADGIWWHPVGADRGSGTDMLVIDGEGALADGKRAVVERFLQLRQADGSLAQPYACAIAAS